MTVSIRFHDAMPRSRRFVTQPKAIIGHASCARYALNATSSPTVSRPLMTSRLPSHKARSALMPRNSDIVGKNAPCSRLSLRLRRRKSRFASRKRAISACSWR